MEHHDWEATHRSLQAALMIKVVHPLLVMDHVVPNAHRHTADEIDATIGQVLKSCVSSLDREDFRKLLHHFHAKWVLLLHASEDNIVAVNVFRTLR